MYVVLTMPTTHSFSLRILSSAALSFYFALLPPIIHSSAYGVRRKDLLKNWDAVCLLAFVGSMISILVMTFVLQLVIQVFVPNLEVSVIELLTFSSLISSVDPVRCFSSL